VHIRAVTTEGPQNASDAPGASIRLQLILSGRQLTKVIGGAEALNFGWEEFADEQETAAGQASVVE
jgi:hypothetical protein